MEKKNKKNKSKYIFSLVAVVIMFFSMTISSSAFVITGNYPYLFLNGDTYSKSFITANNEFIVLFKRNALIMGESTIDSIYSSHSKTIRSGYIVRDINNDNPSMVLSYEYNEIANSFGVTTINAINSTFTHNQSISFE